MGRKTMRKYMTRKVTRRHGKKLRRTKKGGSPKLNISGHHLSNAISDKSYRKASARYGFPGESFKELGEKTKDSAEVREIEKARKAQRLVNEYIKSIVHLTRDFERKRL